MKKEITVIGKTTELALEDACAQLGVELSDVTYEVVEGQDVATVDNSGVLTILKAGEVKVKATRIGGNKFNPTFAEYSLVIEKADLQPTIRAAAKIGV